MPVYDRVCGGQKAFGYAWNLKQDNDRHATMEKANRISLNLDALWVSVCSLMASSNYLFITLFTLDWNHNANINQCIRIRFKPEPSHRQRDADNSEFRCAAVCSNSVRFNFKLKINFFIYIFLAFAVIVSDASSIDSISSSFFFYSNSNLFDVETLPRTKFYVWLMEWNGRQCVDHRSTEQSHCAR